jgi:hypothetical protein
LFLFKRKEKKKWTGEWLQLLFYYL